MTELLENLCCINAPSGCEDNMREYIRKIAEKYCSEVFEDNIGNLIALKKGKSNSGRKIMIAAHMDEVGIIVKRVTKDGMLKFGFVGGVDSRIAAARRVVIGEHNRNGVIGIKAVHLTDAKEREKVPDADSLYIDIGADSQEEALKAVNIGDYGVFRSEWRKMGNLIKCKAIDDRAGCAIMLKLMQEDLPYDVWFAFTVQEEVGLRGATVAANIIKPDVALIVEATTASDLPDTPDFRKACKVGMGAVISFMDRLTIYDYDLFRTMCSEASAAGIPFQIKSYVAGGNDAGAVHLANSGTRCVGVSVPTRYIHSPSCVASAGDVNSALELARLFVNKIGGK